MGRPWRAFSFTSERLPLSGEAREWIAWVRLFAVPFALAEVLIERGNYPSGYERFAWLTTGVFVVGAVTLLLTRARFAGLVLDVVVVSAYVCIYSFEPSSPVRELLFLPVVEAGVLYGARVALVPLASVPALWFFEWKASERLEVSYDVGHVLGPIGLQLLVGLVVGTLARERRQPYY